MEYSDNNDFTLTFFTCTLLTLSFSHPKHAQTPKFFRRWPGRPPSPRRRTGAFSFGANSIQESRLPLTGSQHARVSCWPRSLLVGRWDDAGAAVRSYEAPTTTTYSSALPRYQRASSRYHKV